jgi:hypothetical protein
VSHAAKAFGSVSKDDDACKIFEARVSEMLAMAFTTIQAVSAGRLKGVSAEHLARFGASHMMMLLAPLA